MSIKNNAEKYIEIILDYTPDKIMGYPNLSNMGTEFWTFDDEFWVGYKNYDIYWADTNTPLEDEIDERWMEKVLINNDVVVERLEELIRMYSL